MAKTFSVSYPDELYKQIQERAHVEENNPSDIVRKAVRLYLGSPIQEKGEMPIIINVSVGKEEFEDFFKKITDK